MRCTRHRGLSLLEVIIATGILAASAVMLMSMFATGDKHTRRADERTMAQMLCHSKLDELLANPDELIPIQADVDPQYPGWVFSVAMEPTQLEHFIKLSVSVTRIPGMETGADLELATKSAEQDALGSLSLASVPTEPTFELVRWMQFDGDLSGFDDFESESAENSFSLGRRSNGF